jgi:Nucleotidyltransferase of unknown function (DUF6036)
LSNSTNPETLLAFLREVEKKLDHKIQLVAVGGTAMTLLNLKPSTIDIDFTGPKQDIEYFKQAAQSLHHGFRIDSWPDGQIFAVMLPDDYLAKSSVIRSDLKKIKLRALNLVDIVITKAARLNQRDRQDIESCISRGKLTRKQILVRKGKIEYAGNEKVFDANVNQIVNSIK